MVTTALVIALALNFVIVGAVVDDILHGLDEHTRLIVQAIVLVTLIAVVWK